MRRIFINCLVVFATLFMSSTSVNAQGFLNKLKNAATSALSSDSKEKAESADAASDDAAETDTAAVKAPKWDKIPIYHPVTYNLTNADGTPILNEDGTQAKRVILVDQNGNKRSWEAVHQQCREVNKIVTRIIAKSAGGGILGGIGGALLSSKKDKAKGAAIGAAAGLAAGLALSAGDIKKARAMQKSMKEQETMLEAYQKAFTNEGKPIVAYAELNNIDGIDFDKTEQLSVNAEDLKAECEDAAFNNPDMSWDVD